MLGLGQFQCIGYFKHYKQPYPCMKMSCSSYFASPSWRLPGSVPETKNRVIVTTVPLMVLKSCHHQFSKKFTTSKSDKSNHALLTTNIAAEKWWLEHCVPSTEAYFQVLSFKEGKQTIPNSQWTFIPSSKPPFGFPVFKHLAKPLQDVAGCLLLLANGKFYDGWIGRQKGCFIAAIFLFPGSPTLPPFFIGWFPSHHDFSIGAYHQLSVITYWLRVSTWLVLAHHKLKKCDMDKTKRFHDIWLLNKYLIEYVDFNILPYICTSWHCCVHLSGWWFQPIWRIWV